VLAWDLVFGSVPGRFRVGAKQFLPEQWEEFRNAVGHQEHSLLQDPKLTESHTLGPESPRQIGKETIGPTADYSGIQPAGNGAKLAWFEK